MSTSLTLILFILFVVMGLGLLASLLLIRRAQRKKVDGIYFESSQGPLFFKITGTRGPWVVLIHGLGASSYCWRNIVPSLSRSYRVIHLDLWGFGHSSKRLRVPMSLETQLEILQDLISSLKIKKLRVVGHSMGGQLAVWWAMHDSRIEKCIAIAPAIHPSLVTNWLTLFSWVANWTPLIVSASTVKGMVAGVMQNPSYITEEMVKHYYAPYEDPDAHRSFAAALEIIKDERVFNELPKLRTPSVFIWGAKDQVINERVTRDIKEKLTHSHHITHPECGHLPMEDDHQWLTDQLLTHLKS